MNIPKKVRVGAQSYKVVISKEVGQYGRYGECDSTRVEIRLDADSATQRQEQTLIHELFEAVNFEFAVGLKHHQIELLEVAMCQIVRDNPRLFERGESASS